MDNDGAIKSGKEILDDFFNSVEHIPAIDGNVAAALKELYRQNKLTPANLSNALFKLREDALNDKN